MYLLVILLLVGTPASLASFIRVRTNAGDPFQKLTQYGINSTDRKWLSFGVKTYEEVSIALLGPNGHDIEYVVTIENDIVTDIIFSVTIRNETDLLAQSTCVCNTGNFSTFWFGWRNNVINVGTSAKFPSEELLMESNVTIKGAYLGIKSEELADWIFQREYIGCFTNSTLHKHIPASLNWTVEDCIYSCRTQGQRYAGSKLNGECYCGNNLDPNTTVLNETECNKDCWNGPTSICKGEMMIHLTEVCINGYQGEYPNCTACQRGFYKENINGPYANCKRCPDNSTTIGKASSSNKNCTVPICVVGTYLHNDTTCIPCPIGYYQNQADKPYCKYCPSQMKTKDTGSTSQADCFYEYIGCYYEDDMVFSFKQNLSTTNATSSCLDFCGINGQFYAFIKGSECLCNNSINKAQLDDSGFLCKFPNSMLTFKTQTRPIMVHGGNFKRTYTDFEMLNVHALSGFFFQVQSCVFTWINLYETNGELSIVMIDSYYRDDRSIKVVLRERSRNHRKLDDDCEGPKLYWVDWSDDQISCGAGQHIGHNTLVTIESPDWMDINQVVMGSDNNSQCWALGINSLEDKGLSCSNKLDIENTTTNRSCLCDCRKVAKQVDFTQSELQQKMEKTRKTLKVEVKSTKLYKRKKSSAKDDRLIAVGIGYSCGIFLIVLAMTVVIACDLPNLMQMYKQIRKNLFNKK